MSYAPRPLETLEQELRLILLAKALTPPAEKDYFDLINLAIDQSGGGGGGGDPVATTLVQGKSKVDNNSGGNPIALTVAGHGSDADPHSQYALDSEKGAANGIATLDAGTKLPVAQLPVATTVARGAVRVDNNEAGDPAALTAGGHGAAADPHPQYALDSEKGAASGIATLTAAGKHTAGEIPFGAAANTVTQGDDARLSDSRTPTAHAASHKAGGSDLIKLDELAAPTDVTTLDASATAHGLLPKLPNAAIPKLFLSENGLWLPPRLVNQSVATQAPAAGATTYLTNSSIAVPAGKLRIGSRFVWRIAMTKTAAGAVALAFIVKIGTLGTTGDTSVITFTNPAGTAVADTAWVDIMVNCNGPLSASGIFQGGQKLLHTGGTAGFVNVNFSFLNVTSGVFDVTTAALIVGLAITTGAALAVTIQQLQVEADNL